MDLREHPEATGHAEKEVNREIEACRETLERQVAKEGSVYQESLETKCHKDHREILDQLDPLVFVVHVE